jgi:hypothetical protein
MTKISMIIITLILIITKISNKKLRIKKGKCKEFGEDCGIFTGICCGNFKCKDFRCQMEGAKDIMKWAPDGDKCNFWHICRKGYECHEHRCLEIAI